MQIDINIIVVVVLGFVVVVVVVAVVVVVVVAVVVFGVIIQSGCFCYSMINTENGDSFTLFSGFFGGYLNENSVNHRHRDFFLQTYHR